ncbi:MAG TPA: quinone oxidoreductase, partial [Pseudonocardia sp.]|nr:quinone oxidoreductase [Pseudonocardia sp.]
MRAVVIEQLGGSEMLQLKEWPDPVPGPGELLVDVEYAGVNFMDTATRTGGAIHGRIPFIPGV